VHTVRMQIADLTQKRKIRHELVVESRTSTDCTAVMLSIILEIDDPRRLADPPTAGKCENPIGGDLDEDLDHNSRKRRM
jgi:hypothetical protein